MNADRTTFAYELKDSLARLSLPSASRDGNFKLAWTNSVCILFLLIGICGARQGVIAIKPAPPLQEVIPVVLQPVTLPPQQEVQPRPATEAENNNPRARGGGHSTDAEHQFQRADHRFVGRAREYVCRAAAGTVAAKGTGQHRQQHRRRRRAACAAVSQNWRNKPESRARSVFLLTGDDAGECRFS